MTRLLDLRLALPKALGGTGDASNPEQLFAACFESVGSRHAILAIG